ncbi:hypothetical protein [Treponema lecithinolyticum]|uniref:Lipoprotein n=1 Tax=Treponema lecithinolyticum ATCC 700332 TaxID=1321815 RepID=A0ABN0NXA9_TRELE|nr:hypothetical protein [Treponema lecithinolyticum]ERJ91952.1 hypothetical protein HMPREF9193_01610 [Treponema lecithinolyticum ATCC 700332]
MKRFFYAAVAVAALFFNSCSDTLPALDDVRTMIIYDFEKEKEEPIVRMAVYVKLLSPANRVRSISVFFAQSDYVWNVENPHSVYDAKNDSVWIGSSNIRPAPSGAFEAGEYRVLYADRASKKAESLFTLSEPSAAGKPDMSLYTDERLAVFDAAGTLLAYDLPEKEKELLLSYPQASITRKFVIAADGKSAVLHPAQSVSASSAAAGVSRLSDTDSRMLSGAQGGAR